MLHVKDSSVVFTATLNGSFGAPPVSGSGARMMWYADRVAFRAGQVYGNDWNRDSTGIYSTALGLSNVASGYASLAAGDSNHAKGWGSVALGYMSATSGNFNTAIGQDVRT